MQACRAIGEPIKDLPLHEISVARLLAQLFEVTGRFEMETQPQLLLLQKTMLVAEGVGRRLDPETNMWVVAHPLIEAWMVENRGPPARLRALADDAAEFVAGLPELGPDGAACLPGDNGRRAQAASRYRPGAQAASAASRSGAFGFCCSLGLAAGLALGLLW